MKIGQRSFSLSSLKTKKPKNAAYRTATAEASVAVKIPAAIPTIMMAAQRRARIPSTTMCKLSFSGGRFSHGYLRFSAIK